MDTENLVCLGNVNSVILLDNNGDRSGFIVNVDPDMIVFPDGLKPCYTIRGGKITVGTIFIKLNDPNYDRFFSDFTEKEPEKNFHTYDITLDYNFG